METMDIPGPWAAAERILVSTPWLDFKRLVRVTRRLSGELNADWEAVYVEPCFEKPTEYVNISPKWPLSSKN